MDRHLIRREINHNRELADKHFIEWQSSRDDILMYKINKCIEIADALELALQYVDKEDVIELYKKMILELAIKVNIALMCPREDEKKRILNEIVREVTDEFNIEREVLC